MLQLGTMGIYEYEYSYVCSTRLTVRVREHFAFAWVLDLVSFFFF